MQHDVGVSDVSYQAVLPHRPQELHRIVTVRPFMINGYHERKKYTSMRSRYPASQLKQKDAHATRTANPHREV